ncbi:preprotein translocase subunit SecA [Patescibacteria group bacterium]|nr:preprotein translocase subunit SecA [Patescibacteria group bacterium]
MSFFHKIFGDPNKKTLGKLTEAVGEINALEPQVQNLSDDEIKQKIRAIRDSICGGKSTDAHLVEVFALVRESSKRVLNMRHFDVQLIGGIVLHQGKIAEMKTGEGKTLVATLPVVLNALEGKGVHVVTVNEYLAKRDAEWMGKLYDFLGLSVGVTLHGQSPEEKKQAYDTDVTYGTNNEFGFDYLRDNMVQDNEEKVQKELHFAIVDEVDSILIDEARTPLIISAPASESTDDYARFSQLVSRLKEGEDYNLDEKMKAATLSEEGVAKMEQMLGLSNIYEEKGIRTVHHIEQALRALTLFKLDRDYVVKEGEVIIVDEFTGRLMPGRRYSEGLHQAIEAKEGVSVQRESMTLATVTFQNYFRMFKKLSGMTGTAATEAEEFNKIYALDVVVVPTNKPIQRDDQNDLIYQSELGKYNAIVERVRELKKKGQPVLIGTVSIEKNEKLSGLLTEAGIEHNVLNAKKHEREAEIIAQAGKIGGVTVATNMAGRGVDIVLGGNPTDSTEAETVKQNGGLFVLGTERHEARRIDNQLRGRSGRQGDPGASQFYVSTDDDLMRLFGSERMKSMMGTLNIPEDMPIEHKLISRSIESAQKKVEGHNFDIRKHLVEYDDVMNKHREVIYSRRDAVLRSWEWEKAIIEAGGNVSDEQKRTKPKDTLRELVLGMVDGEIENIIVEHSSKEDGKEWDFEEISEVMATICPVPSDLHISLLNIYKGKDKNGNGVKTRTRCIEYLSAIAHEQYKAKEDTIGTEIMRHIEKTVMLQTIDKLWVDHLEDMVALREGIGLRGYGQRDPLVEYKKESFKAFQQLLTSLQHRIVHTIYKVGVVKKDDTPMKKENMQFSGAKKGETSQEPIKKGDKVGRNDPCPCGSGKKYKKCCGKSE